MRISICGIIRKYIHYQFGVYLDDEFPNIKITSQEKTNIPKTPKFCNQRICDPNFSVPRSIYRHYPKEGL